MPSLAVLLALCLVAFWLAQVKKPVPPSLTCELPLTSRPIHVGLAVSTGPTPVGPAYQLLQPKMKPYSNHASTSMPRRCASTTNSCSGSRPT